MAGFSIPNLTYQIDGQRIENTFNIQLRQEDEGERGRCSLVRAKFLLD